MLLITNARVLTPDSILENGAVCIEGPLVKEAGDSASLAKKYPAAELIDAKGGLVMPGLANCHMHLYSTFARGMYLPSFAPGNFVDILKGLWWRLDKALTSDDIYYSSIIPLIECVKSGTTTVIDHHASPNFAKGSLSRIKDALSAVPVRASLCYEVSDRDGPEIAAAGIEENAQFIEANLGGEMATAMFGLHASMTVSDETLKKCISAAGRLGCGFHVHTAEDKADVADSEKKYGLGVIERWNARGILGPKTILAHCIHISDREIDILSKTGTNAVHNPESNMNNAVGCADVVKMLAKGVVVGLGTDGMTSNMFQEAKFAHLIRKHVTGDPKIGFMEAGRLLFENNYRILSNFFGRPLGRIEPGAYADIIILDYAPPTPLTKDNFWGHFLYGMNSSLVGTTIINGRVLMREKKLVGIDEEEIAASSRALAKKLWERI